MSWARVRTAMCERAFTLTELLIVIAIMGLLAGVGMWSLATTRSVAEPIAGDVTAAGEQLRCDAARGDLLLVAGCEGQTLPAALAEPVLGPIATTLTVDPDDETSGVGGTATLTITVLDQDDEPFEDAALRYEIVGISVLGGTVSTVTDASGSALFSYGRSTSGVDTITVCTNVDGTLPDDCDSANGPSDTVTHTWALPRPTLVSWSRVSNSVAEVVWSTPLGAMFDQSGYRVYLNEANCTDDSGAATITNRSVIGTDGNGQTTVEITISGVSLQPGQLGQRRLRVLDTTETNVDALGNLATSCLSAGAVPSADNLTVAPQDGATEVGDTATFTVTVTDANNDGYGGASVRYEISGISDLSGAASSATNDNGVTTFSYSRSDEGEDTVTACTNIDGSLPSTCAEATGPSATTSHTWTDDPPPPLPAPTVVRWGRGTSNSQAAILWDQELGATFNVTGYRIYGSQANCTNDQQAATVDVNSRSTSVSGGQTTVRININGVNLQNNANQMNNRYLRVLANTETNIEGGGNVQTGCIQATFPFS